MSRVRSKNGVVGAVQVDWKPADLGRIIHLTVSTVAHISFHGIFDRSASTHCPKTA